jgi:microcompartment protein CcmK/EutM
MLQGIVVGNVWSTKRIDGLPNGAFLEVEVTGSGDRLVAFDVLGSGPGERVLIAQGSVASGWLPDRPPVDALIIGSIDEPAMAVPPAAEEKKKTASGARSRK